MRVLTGVVAAFIVSLAAPLGAAQAGQASAEAAKVQRLLLDVERADALRQAKRLNYRHAALVLDGRWDALADLYSRDAVVTVDDRTLHGRAEIRAWLVDLYGGGHAEPRPRALHVQLVLSPVVTLSPDGRSAKGRWAEIVLTGAYGDRADWYGDEREDEYVVEDGAWKIARVRHYPLFKGPYANGWLSVAHDLKVPPYHFIPSQAGRPVPDIPGGLARPPIETPEQVAAGLALSERRIAALNDEDAVLNLQNAYGYYVDRKMWDDVADLFVADGRIVIGGIGEYDGKRGIRRALALDGPAGLGYGQVNDKVLLHTIVTILPGGREAVASGLQFGMISPRLGEAYWDIAAFENRFAKGVDGKWRIAAVRLSPIVRSDYYQGWAKSWLAPARPPRALAPDRPAPKAMLLRPEARPQQEAGERATAIDPPAFSRRLSAASTALDRSKAFDAIENVSSALGYYLDDFEWEAFADSYSADGWKPRAGGYYVGRDHIYRSMAQAYMAGPSPTMIRDTIRAHMRVQPVIDVAPDAKSAHIRTRLFQYIINDKEPGTFNSGMYPNDAAVLEDGVWKLSVGGAIDEKYFESATWKDGWARPAPPPKVPDAATLAIRARLANPVDFPPDVPESALVTRLQGFTRGSPGWPAIRPMWFAYANPVSGRIPENYCPDLRTCEPLAQAQRRARESGAAPTGESGPPR